MPELVRVTINGRECRAEKGEYLMEVARRNRIPIPGFCHHEGLAGQGCCRVCVVEVTEKGRSRVVVSCVYPVGTDCEVRTDTDKIKAIRRTVLSMLRGRAPDGNRIASLCAMYGVPEDSRYSAPAPDLQPGTRAAACILCGLCVEACSGLGTGAISAVGRGTGKKISTPFDEPSADCVGCGSCASVCPTGAIDCTEAEGTRAIWGRTFELVRCERCRRAFATGEELAHSAARAATAGGEGPAAAAEPPGLCGDCRRRKAADVMAGVFGAA